MTFYLSVQGFHRTYATGAACHQRTLTPPDTWSCPTLGLACVSNVETNLSWTCLFSGILNFEHPSVLLFCLAFRDNPSFWTSTFYHIFLGYIYIFFSVDLEISVSDLQSEKRLEKMLLTEICNPVPAREVTRLWTPQINRNILPPAMREQNLDNMIFCMSSDVFRRILGEKKIEEFANVQKISPSSKIRCADFFNKVWIPSHRTWQSFMNRIRNEDITIAEIQDLFGIELGQGLPEQVIHTIRKELSMMKMKQEVIATRLEQIGNFYTLRTCSEAARVMLEIREVLQLTHDFKALKSIAESVSYRKIKLSKIW